MCQYYIDELYDKTIRDSESFKLKAEKTGNTPNDSNTKDAETAVPLKNLRNPWRTLDMPLFNCKINLILT